MNNARHAALETLIPHSNASNQGMSSASNTLTLLMRVFEWMTPPLTFQSSPSSSPSPLMLHVRFSPRLEHCKRRILHNRVSHHDDLGALIMKHILDTVVSSLSNLPSPSIIPAATSAGRSRHHRRCLYVHLTNTQHVHLTNTQRVS